MQKFTKYKGNNNVFSNNCYGPYFGKKGGDLYLYSDLNLGKIKSGNILRNCELTKGETDEFKIKELRFIK